MKHLTVADVMTTNVLRARPAMPLKELARVLAEHEVSALPVLDADDRVIGMVSERDVLAKQGRPSPGRPHWWQPRRARAEIRRAAGDTVGQVMTTGPVTVGPDAPLAQAARLMADHEVKRLPVVDDHGALLGIVSRGDLMKAYLRTDEDIKTEVTGEVLMHVLWIDPTTVTVTVQDGVVTLHGTVEQRSTAGIAERLVRRVDGVIDVVNELEYGVDDRKAARGR
ncbi:CBS domain-containing protein [Pseudonocardia bannensis]|uniref:CBS domain-containing protein n=1 Tax=Pseudonocardia bannensis TaxID=630973 RepID=A0A848DF81_9PSEU|nr:CBS domain-containing protein [Pseudonocardia bannensis]NMH91224.1 CBS domain-containing protein [Pseudonocardia bannensis]